MYLKILTLCILPIFSGSVYAQQHIEKKMTDTNPVYSIEGTGYHEQGTKNRINFSKLTSANDKSEVSLNNNEITVHKTGVYRINLISETGRNTKAENQVPYYVNLNGKEAFRGSGNSLDDTGYYFQIQLKKGDILSFDVPETENAGKSGTNKLNIRFSDPELFELSE